MTTGFKDVIKSNKVTFNISIGVSNTITYPGLSSKIHNYLRMVVSEDGINNSLFSNAVFNENKSVAISRQFLQAFIL